MTPERCRGSRAYITVKPASARADPGDRQPLLLAVGAKEQPPNSHDTIPQA